MGKWGKKKQRQQSKPTAERPQPDGAVIFDSTGYKHGQWRRNGLIALLVVALLVLATLVYQKFRHKSDGPVVHSVEEVAFKPTEFQSKLLQINQLFRDKKPQEAIDAAKSAANGLNTEDQKALNLSMSAQCYVAGEFACAAEYYGKLNPTDLLIDQQVRYADAKEKTGDKQGALTLYQSIKANRSTYADYESAPIIDKQVDEAIARLQ